MQEPIKKPSYDGKKTEYVPGAVVAVAVVAVVVVAVVAVAVGAVVVVAVGNTK